MLKPDFSKSTIEVLAKRAAYRCSNPDCRVNTVGPNMDPKKATMIGEAAHICGARPGSKRFRKEMGEVFRADLTNAIWLCRNCHKLIDSDDRRYTVETLLVWREEHENHVLRELGSNADKLEFDARRSRLSQFESYPAIVRRIASDRTDGWEHRLTAELMRALNAPVFRKIRDLRDGLYTTKQNLVRDNEASTWIQSQLNQREKIVSAFSGLIDRLNDAWGGSGESGDQNEIHHICKLIRDDLEEVVRVEENAYFPFFPISMWRPRNS